MSKTRVRDTNETLPLGGQYTVSRDEIGALADYMNYAEGQQEFVLWRGTSGTLYLKGDGGTLYPMPPKQ